MVVTNEVAPNSTDVSSARSVAAGPMNRSTTSGDALVETRSTSINAGRYRSRHRPHTSSTRTASVGRGSRIALFTGNYLSVTDGVSRTLQRLVYFLRARGHRVLVVGPSDPHTSSMNVEPSYVAVPSIAMPGRPEYRLTMGLPKAVCRQLDEFNADLIHLATPDLLGIGALSWAESRQLPVVSTYHTHFPSYLHFYRLGRLKKPLESYFRWFYSRCRHVYVPTEPLAAYFQQLGLRDNVRLWGRGVDCLRFHPRHRSESWRRQHSVGPDDFLVAYVGRLVKEKDLDVFESVIGRLHAQYPMVRSMIVGDGPMRAPLQARLPNTIFKGHLEGAALATAFASSDIFLFPSPSEAFGNVIVEAMASGLPVVCAGASPSSSHIINDETGLHACPGDADDFLKQVLKLIRNQEKRITMGICARWQAQHYDWPQTLNQLALYYDEVRAKT